MALFFTYLLPLSLPTAFYLLWRLIVTRRSIVPNADSDAETTAGNDGDAITVPSNADLMRDAPWLWLALAGAGLLAIVLLLGAFVHGTPPREQYLPPRLEKGQILPGELRPAETGTGRSDGSSRGAP